MRTNSTATDKQQNTEKMTTALEDEFKRISETEGLNPFSMEETGDMSQLNGPHPPDDVFKILSALLHTLDGAQQPVSSDNQTQEKSQDKPQEEQWDHR